MATFSQQPMDHFTYSTMWNPHPTFESDAFPPHYPMITGEYCLPPNESCRPRESDYSDGDSQQQYGRHRSPYHAGQISSADSYPDAFYRNGFAPRASSGSSATTSLTDDSLSPRPSPDRFFGEPEQYLHQHFHTQHMIPGGLYTSPMMFEGLSVTPTEVLHNPDIPENPMSSIGPISTPMRIDTPHMDPGLQTPSSGTVSTSLEQEPKDGMHIDGESDGNDDSGEYSPQPRRTRSRKPKPASPRATTSSLKGKRAGNKVTKPVNKGSRPLVASSPKKLVSPTHCPHCGEDQGSKAACERHIQSTHTRPFSCIFERYGCTATFGAKNEWKRHCSTQHLRLSFYRCDVGQCKPQNAQKPLHQPGWELPIASQAGGSEYNDFNRKDLFIQHHRRMHAPEGSNDGTQSEKDKFKAQCEKAAQRCRVSARAAPPRTICGLCEAKGCPMVFEGARAWETRMEHVGRHLENAKGERMEWVEDAHLKQWLIDEGLIQQTSRGDWKLTDHMKSEDGRNSRR